MAASLFFMSANPSATNDDMSGPKIAVPGSETARADSIQRQQRTRRPSNKTPAPIKQRRRGLGVAELERLSNQDRIKRMSEIPQFSGGQFFAAPGLQYCMAAASEFPGTVRGFVVPASGGYGTGGRAVGSPYGQLVGAPVVLAESRELTSMPNNVLQQQQCSVLSCSSTCFKKNEIINGGSVSGMISGLDRAKTGETRVRSSGTRKKLMDSNINGCGGDFLELNLGNYNHVQGGSAVNCCDGIHTHSPVLEKEVEVMAVRRKMKKNNSSSSSVVLEYEFFPGKANYRSSLNLQEELSIHHNSSSNSYASHSSSSSSIDLSLKLSYNNNNY